MIALDAVLCLRTVFITVLCCLVWLFFSVFASEHWKLFQLNQRPKWKQLFVMGYKSCTFVIFPVRLLPLLRNDKGLMDYLFSVAVLLVDVVVVVQQFTRLPLKITQFMTRNHLLPSLHKSNQYNILMNWRHLLGSFFYYQLNCDCWGIWSIDE